MKTMRVRWNDWDTIRCTAADVELIVGVSAGPRFLSLRYRGGNNLLHLDTTDFRVGDWRLYGGHRFTVAPEGPQSYEPDNAPCEVRQEAAALSITAPTDCSGLQRNLKVTPTHDGVGFDLHHVLENQGRNPWTGALWAITCVPRSGPVVAPRGPGRLRFWPGTDVAPWDIGAEALTIVATGTRGKAGWHSNPAWLASLQPDAAFVIHAPQAPAREHCVDDGSNVEVFTGADYVELETLGGRVTLPPGGRAHHLQRWRILPPIYSAADWRALGADAGCSAVASALHEP
ncbi:MAG: hypothetical protein JNK85_12115 [Verrucomicrobiales bacterium]|nr:hypothetical protein [Verrucomicrobiales bacterium]